jgi:ferredoxin
MSRQPCLGIGHGWGTHPTELRYNYQGAWSIDATYKQFDSVRCDGIRYCEAKEPSGFPRHGNDPSNWANPKAGNSAPPSIDWEEI